VKDEQSIDMAKQFLREGKLREAEDLCERQLQRQPNNAEATFLLGVIAQRTGRLDAAVCQFRRLIDLSPDSPEPHNFLANALRSKGLTEEAIAEYRDAVRLDDRFAHAHYNLGGALRELGRLEDAIAAFRKALALRADFVDAANDLGSALRQTGQFHEAAEILMQAARQAPQFYKVQNNLGNALRLLGRFEEAETAVRNALKLRPDIPEIHVNLGNVLRDKGDLDGAIEATREAIRLRPTLADAHQNLGSQLLLAGRYVEAWPEHEWRWRCEGMTPARAARLRPQWDGSNLDGRTILLHSDAGLGDAIHCLRYVPPIADRGGGIIVECQPELHPLVRELRGVMQVIAPQDPLPHFDVHCPLMSLPGVFVTTPSTIPCQIPYLQTNQGQVADWARRLARSSHPLVGLVWAGNPANSVDRIRSMPFTTLAPLCRIPGVTFHSLQLGDAARQLQRAARDINVIDHSMELTDFAQTAALVMNLDLVISVDTSAAHLTGALAKPIWVMLPFAPDWRWMLNRQDSPWYPTMRLFRQKQPGDWTEVIGRVADELETIVRQQVNPRDGPKTKS
jgi:tetratricopeptide (TPR) repeat protein